MCTQAHIRTNTHTHTHTHAGLPGGWPTPGPRRSLPPAGPCPLPALGLRCRHFLSRPVGSLPICKWRYGSLLASRTRRCAWPEPGVLRPGAWPLGGPPAHCLLWPSQGGPQAAASSGKDEGGQPQQTRVLQATVHLWKPPRYLGVQDTYVCFQAFLGGSVRTKHVLSALRVLPRGRDMFCPIVQMRKQRHREANLAPEQHGQGGGASI